MLVVSISVKSGRIYAGQTKTTTSLSVRIVDVQKGEPAWTSKSISATTGGEATGGQEQEGEEGGPARPLLTEVLDYIDKQIALQDMPAYTAEEARRRGVSLVAAQYANPLPALMELRYYQYKKLLTAEEIAGFYAKIVGAEEGPRLATGPEEQRQEIVQRWLTK